MELQKQRAIAVTDSQWEAWKEAAHKARLSLREWIRQACDEKAS